MLGRIGDEGLARGSARRGIAGALGSFLAGRELANRDIAKLALTFWASCSNLWNMVIVGFDIVAALIIREKRRRARQGRTLERRVAAWKQEVEQARWRDPAEVKAIFGRADVVGSNRIVFDVCGNNYRIVVQFNYAAGIARIRFAGTHAEYDKIDVRTI
jgi:mRNA interferase HigB